MDSISTKQNYLSMTGIDDIENLTSDMRNFVKEVVPNFVTKNADETITSSKTFTNNVTTSGVFVGTGLASISDSISISVLSKTKVSIAPTLTRIANDVVELSGNVIVKGTLLVGDNTLSMENVAGLKDALAKSVTLGANSVVSSTISDSAILNRHIPVNEIDGSKIKTGTLTSQQLASNVNINSTGSIQSIGNITATGNLYVGGSYTSVTRLIATSIEVGNGTPLLNISIPFFPKTLIPKTIGDVSFFVNDVTYLLTRYRHPVSYYIHGFSVMHDVSQGEKSATIYVYSYPLSGIGNSIALLGTCIMQLSATKRCDYVPLTPPAHITATNCLGLSHAFSAKSSGKEVQYVLWGYQG